MRIAGKIFTFVLTYKHFSIPTKIGYDYDSMKALLTLLASNPRPESLNPKALIPKAEAPKKSRPQAPKTLKILDPISPF